MATAEEAAPSQGQGHVGDGPWLHLPTELLPASALPISPGVPPRRVQLKRHPSLGHSGWHWAHKAACTDPGRRMTPRSTLNRGACLCLGRPPWSGLWGPGACQQPMSAATPESLPQSCHSASHRLFETAEHTFTPLTFVSSLAPVTDEKMGVVR